MKMLSSTLAVVGALAIALISDNALACGGHGHAGKGHGMIKKLIRSANLTPEQRKQFKAMRQQFRAKHESIAKGHKGQFIGTLAAAIESGDESELDEVFAAQNQRRIARQKLRRMKIKKVLSLLTDEQRAQVAAQMRKAGKKHRKHRKHRKQRRHRKGGDYH